MNAKRFRVFMVRTLAVGLLLLLHAPSGARADAVMEELLPPDSCGTGWKIEGKPLFYDRETLSDRINGESELYFPYGFDRLAAARYVPEKSPGVGMDVEIYRMGSLLDAFGMYANYRQKEGRALPAGAESNLSGSQMFLYQGRYFVHIQITGTDAAVPDILVACAQRVASRLPGHGDKPRELAVLDRSEIVKGTERYLPQSLLGYDFLNRGIMADAVIEGVNLQIFLLQGTTAESAATAFTRYRSQLAMEKSGSEGKSAALLEGIDPLYGPVLVVKKGSCLAGAVKFSENKGVRALLESLCK